MTSDEAAKRRAEILRLERAFERAHRAWLHGSIARRHELRAAKVAAAEALAVARGREPGSTLTDDWRRLTGRPVRPNG